MSESSLVSQLGITQDGIRLALEIKEGYRTGEPICVPGDRSRILVPELLLNSNLDLQEFDDPLPLAVMATRDPEPPMALAAAARMGPLGGRKKLLGGVFGLVGEATRHPTVRKCVELITEHDFDPAAISAVRRQASRMVMTARAEYSTALRQNLTALMEGVIAPRQFVREFFELTEAGNLRNEIRKKLVVSLLLSESIRPSIKFLMLENFTRMPMAVRLAIISAVLRAEPSRHLDVIKEELKWIVTQEKVRKDIH
ncbi:MAG: hypothetical protein H7841_03380 [Magnetospirillum sp. WYHS-4]